MEKNTLEEIIGGNIAKYRNRAGMTQGQLAERAGISTAFVSRVERGLKMMKIQTLLTIAQTLNVSCDALLHYEERIGHLENIKRLLSDQPAEYLVGIEKLIRACVEEFDPKPKMPLEID